MSGKKSSGLARQISKTVSTTISTAKSLLKAKVVTAVKNYGAANQTSPTLDLLIRKGYFPLELPHFFTCDALADYLLNNEKTILSHCNKTRKHISFRLARPGNAPRILGIPNPVSYIGLCKFIEENWGDLHGKCSTYSGALSSPKLSLPDGERAIARQYNIECFREKKLSQRRKGRFLLKTDIAKFYPSIYTHSLDWAIRGKDVAKQDQNAKLPNAIKLGCELDKRIRQCQDNQTNGIIIGPDSSFLAAEIIMGRVDTVLSGKTYTRNTDDFEFITNTREEAEAILASLIKELEKFDLSINDAKTEIIPLPAAIEKPWVARLRQFSLGQSYWKWQKDQLFDYFNTAFELSKQYPHDSVLRFAIGKLKNKGVIEKIHNYNLQYLVDFSMHCALAEPGTLKNIMALIDLVSEKDFLNYTAIEETLNKIIALHAPLNHSSEVCWALWAMASFNLPSIMKVQGEALKNLKETTDCLSIVLALYIANKGHIDEDLTKHKPWADIITRPEAYPEYWLLCYEAAVRGWAGMTPQKLISNNNNDYLGLKILADAGVTFLK